MRRWVVVVCFAMMFSAVTVPATALPAEPVGNSMLFGGQWTPANNATAGSMALSEMPAVVEVFTATWCENCVDVEHALDDVQDLGLLQQYHIHRAIGESQDPFGTEVLDQRWRDRYGASSPPAVVFNGTMKKIGSKADDGTLVNEFSNLAKADLGLGEGNSTFVWTPLNGSGSVEWLLDIDERHLENATLSVAVFIVETAADFEEGTNGLGTYPHIVRDIHLLGDQRQGTAQITMPEPFDGDDLEVHLLYEIIANPVADDPVIKDDGCPGGDDCESEDTPALSFSLVLVAMAGAAIIRTRRSVA